MLEQLLDLIGIVKYILIGIAIIGVIMLLVGFFRRENTLLTRGGYMLVMAVILWVCGYFILEATADRAQQKIEDVYIRY